MNKSIISYRPVKTVKELKDNLKNIDENVSLDQLFRDYLLIRRTEKVLVKEDNEPGSLFSMSM